jgi:hypothetical protein
MNDGFRVGDLSDLTSRLTTAADDLQHIAARIAALAVDIRGGLGLLNDAHLRETGVHARRVRRQMRAGQHFLSTGPIPAIVNDPSVLSG